MCAYLVFVCCTLLISAPSYSQDNVPSTSLILFVGSADETAVRYRIDFSFSSPVDNYTLLNVLVPFPTEKTLYHPSRTICTWQNFENSLTLVHVIVPPNYVEFSIELLSERIITLSATGESKKLSLDFAFEDAPAEVKWIGTQNNTIDTFDEVRVSFPYPIDMPSIDDTPSATLVQGQTRIYPFDEIVKTGGTLIIRYPNPQSRWLIWAESVLAGSLGLTTALVIFITTDEEKIRRRRKVTWLAIIILLIGTISLTPIWIFAGSWPINRIFPIWISCTANAIVVTSWVRILRQHEDEHVMISDLI